MFKWRHFDYRVVLVLTLLALFMAGCTGDTPVPTPTATPRPGATASPTIAPSPTMTPTPLPRTLSICLGSEPASLYLYDDYSYAATVIREAIYDGPIDVVDYAYRPTILEKLPSLADGDAVVEPVPVGTGDRVVAASGEVMTLEPNMLVRPSGCRSTNCEVTFDGTPITMDHMRVAFKLKAGLTWSDGTPLTAQDSVYSFELASDPDTIKGVWLELRTAEYAAQDAQTVLWTGLPGYLPHDYALSFWDPLPAHAWSTYPAADLPTQSLAARSPLSYGPYVVAHWEPGQYIQVAPNPYYYRSGEGLPFFDDVTFRFLSNEDVNTAIEALRAGTCDILGLDFYLERGLAQLRDMEAQGQAKLYAVPSDVWEHITFNVSLSPTYDAAPFFADGLVRYAFASCINRQRLVDEVFYGASVIPDSYIPPSHPFYAADLISHYPYDPAQGESLLEAAGWRDADGDGVREAHGVPGVVESTPFSVRYVIDSSPLREQIGALVAEDMAACGVQVVVEPLEPDFLYASGPATPLYGREFDVVELAWLAEVYPSCDLYHSAEIPAYENRWDAQNFSGYADATYDAACDRVMAALPGEADYLIALAETQRIFSEALPALPLAMRPRFYAARPDLLGFLPDPTNIETWNLESFWIGP